LNECPSCVAFHGLAIILDGVATANKIFQAIRAEINALKIVPKLGILLVGKDPASEIYVRNKLAQAGNLGIAIELVRLPWDSSEKIIFDAIEKLDGDASVNGVIIQAPLPDRSMQNAAFNRISLEKDVDGFGDSNVAKLARGTTDGFVPCTPHGICKLLKEYGIGFWGKHVVIIGRSDIVGRPLSMLLSQKSENFNATVTLCHSQTKNLENITRLADIIVVAVGKKFFLVKDMIRRGVVVVDVGINREACPDSPSGYRVRGDVDFENIKNLCHAITPVPGGVGPMTIAMLMNNTLVAAKRQNLI
jgi:methylenetetrahydrofolate dehydrogenase (NADP+)/methenyltetrahydrofolate cyclohydrolase